MSDAPATSLNQSQVDQMIEQHDGREEVSRYEFELLLKEYETATSYALHWLTTDGRDMEFTLVAISGAIVASTFAVENQVYSALLVLALPFYVLIWAQIHRGIDSQRRLSYIIEELAKRLNEITHSPINKGEKSKNRFVFLSYEAKLSEISKRDGMTTLVTSLPNMGRGLFKLFAALFLIFTYFHQRSINPSYTGSIIIDSSLLILNLLALLATILAVVVIARLHKQGIRFVLEE